MKFTIGSKTNYGTVVGAWDLGVDGGQLYEVAYSPGKTILVRLQVKGGAQ